MGHTVIRIAIADDHALFTEGLRNALDTQPDFHVEVIADSGHALGEAMRGVTIDVALIDLEMPGGGLEALKGLPADTKAIVVTMHPDGAFPLLSQGARAVLSKSAPLATLSATIRAVHAGEVIPQGADLTNLLARYSTARLDPGAESLTQRERELLRVLAHGVTSTEEIAQTLFISQKTVKNHLASIFVKLAVADRTQAAIEAIRLGIAPPR